MLVSRRLFLGFLVHGLCAAPITELFEFNLPLHNLLVFMCGVVGMFACRTTQVYHFLVKLSLCHMLIIIYRISQNL